MMASMHRLLVFLVLLPAVALSPRSQAKSASPASLGSAAKPLAKAPQSAQGSKQGAKDRSKEAEQNRRDGRAAADSASEPSTKASAPRTTPRPMDRHELYRQRKEARDAALKRLAQGVLRLRKLSYKSREGAFEVPCYVFEEREDTSDVSEASARRTLRRRAREKRPLLIWIHGGVHGDFDESYFPFVAEAVRRGYIVVAPEYRGSTGYGKEHYDAIDYGGYEVVDCLSARDFAARNLPNADVERTAMIGFSHGGFITMHGLVNAPDELVCGVAMVPVTNLLFRLAQKGPRYQRLFARQKRDRWSAARAAPDLPRALALLHRSQAHETRVRARRDERPRCDLCRSRDADRCLARQEAQARRGQGLREARGRTPLQSTRRPRERAQPQAHAGAPGLLEPHLDLPRVAHAPVRALNGRGPSRARRILRATAKLARMLVSRPPLLANAARGLALTPVTLASRGLALLLLVQTGLAPVAAAQNESAKPSQWERTRALAAQIGTAYVAKTVASAVFVARRDLASLRRAELRLPQVALLGRLLEIEIDRRARLVRASALGVTNIAFYRPGFGCTLLRTRRGKTPTDAGSVAKMIAALEAQLAGVWPAPKDRRPARGDRDASKSGRKRWAASPRPRRAWPRYERGAWPEALDRNALERAIDSAFAKRGARTRAVVVIHDGHLVAERYAKGFQASTAQRGWSMNKSLLNALIGARLQRAPFAMSRAKESRRNERTKPSADAALRALDLPIRVAAWDKVGDARRVITLRQLLRMSSNLSWNENYADFSSDSIQMLFALTDTGAFAASKQLAGPAGARWSYSSGTSNLLSRALRESFDSHAEYLRFPYQALFGPIGMQRAVLELDPSGTFVASSFGWATPRDWARLGELFRKDGVWDGKRILPEGWVRASLRPAPKSPQGRYGLHWWLNRGQREDGSDRPMPQLPRCLFFASGFEQQVLAVIPSKKLVAVRLGCTHSSRSWSDAKFIESLCAVVDPTRKERSPEPRSRGKKPAAALASTGGHR